MTARRFFPEFLIVIVLMGIAASLDGAWASCSAARIISSKNFTGTSYLYTPGHPFAPTNCGSGEGCGAPYYPHGSTTTYYLQGFFWSLGYGDPAIGVGHDAGIHFGMYEYPINDPPSANTWLYVGYHDDTYYVPTFLGSAPGLNHWQVPGVDGCIDDDGSDPLFADPDQCTAILLSDDDGRGTGYFAALTVPPTLGGDYYANLVAGNGPIELAPVPVPSVEASDLVAPGELEVQLSVSEPVSNAGVYLGCHPWQNEQILEGYRIYASARAPGSPAPRDRNVAGSEGWELVPLRDASGAPIEMATFGAEATAMLHCSEETNFYLATAVRLDSGYETPYLSANAQVVTCNVCTGTDGDGDGYCTQGQEGVPADCDDTSPTVYPGAPQLCDGINNDCDDAMWPAPPGDEVDDDGDLLAECEGDCDDTDFSTAPTAAELCNGADDNCNGLVDENESGVDPDGDGVASACDNCPDLPNADQADVDADGVGDACDGCRDLDRDGFGAPGTSACPGGIAGDCDDGNRFRFPGSPELYDGVDNDCDGFVDEGLDDDMDGVPNFRDACPGTPAGAGTDASGCAVCSAGEDGNDDDDQGGGHGGDDDGQGDFGEAGAGSSRPPLRDARSGR